MRLASQGGTRPLCKGRSALPVRWAIGPEIGASRRKSEGLGHFPRAPMAAASGSGNISRCRCVSIQTAKAKEAAMKAKPFVIAISAAALFAASQVSAQSPHPSANETTAPGVTAKPGKVGPGSENNARVSPTSPAMTSPTPPDLPPGSSAGASSGSSGKSSSVTTSPGSTPPGNASGQSGASTPGQNANPGNPGSPPTSNPSR